MNVRMEKVKDVFYLWEVECHSRFRARPWARLPELHPSFTTPSLCDPGQVP